MAIGLNRTLGFVGALLTVLGTVAQFISLEQFFYPFAGFTGFSALFVVLGFVGLILFLIAMYGLGKDYGDSSIFNNVLYGFLSSIIGGIVTAVIAVAVVFSHLSSIISTFNPTTFPPTSLSEILQDFFVYLIPVFIAASIIALVQALFYMRAFNRLANKSGVRLFRTVGLLLVVGAALGIIMAFTSALLVLAASVSANVVLYLPIVSGVVSFVAWILATKAFYSIRAPTSQAPPPPTSQIYTPATGQVRYCSYCGAQNRLDAAYCAQCGKKL